MHLDFLLDIYVDLLDIKIMSLTHLLKYLNFHVLLSWVIQIIIKKQPTSSNHTEAITHQFCLYTSEAISPIGKNLSVMVIICTAITNFQNWLKG